MYEYKFERVTAEPGFAKRNFKDHRKLIEQYGEAGYKFSGFVPTEIIGQGTIIEIDLVFVKES